MITKINKERLELIRTIRKASLQYSIAQLNRQYTINLRLLAKLAEERVF